MLLVRAGLLVAVIRLVLWTRPWPSALRTARCFPFSRLFPSARRESADRLAWAVGRASLLVPVATCLTQSLALQCALTAAGLSSSVEIGVAKEAGGEFRAHAWVEQGGRVLLSTQSEIRSYTRMLTLKALPTPPGAACAIS
jgi:hypothetical protein